METVVAYAAAGIGVVLGLLGMLVSVHGPQAPAEKRALAASFGLLALVAVGTAYAHYRLESRQSTDLSDLRSTESAYQEEVKALKGANDLATTANEKLVEQNAALQRRINELENRVASAETSQALKREIDEHLREVRTFSIERAQELKELLATALTTDRAALQRRFQVSTASLFFKRFFPTTVSLLQRAADAGFVPPGSFATDDAFIQNSIMAGVIPSTHLRQLTVIAAQL